MELTKEQQAYLDICEKNGWSYDFFAETNEVELSQSSPAGEDFSFIVSLEDLPEKVHSFIFNFDVDEHVEMWIEAKREGVSGVPTTRELVDDAEAIEQMLEELSRALLDHKKDMVVDGLKVTIDGPADSLAVMERLTKQKQSKPHPVHVAAPEKTEPKQISPKADIAMGREAASQSPQDHNHNIGRSR